MSLTCFAETAAQGNIIFYPDLLYRVEKDLLRVPSYHSCYNSQGLSLKRREYLIDSIYKGVGRNLIHREKPNIALYINPIFQSTYQVSPSLLQHHAIGFFAEAEFRNKITFDANFSSHLLTNHPFSGTRLDSAHIAYHWGKTVDYSQSFQFFNSLNGKLTYSPNRYLSFQAGKDKHFLGDGYRSLFLSDFAPSYPFIQTSLKVWKIKYSCMVAILKDDTIGNYAKLHTKYLAMHFLSWNVTPRLNFNIFETVIWYQRNTGTSKRGFDVNYLNPFIFYRPLEYNLGSPDNVLIGFGEHYRIARRLMVYGQLMLDEFYFKEIKNNKGWWGNKNAIQMGAKWFDVLGINNLYMQLEYNQARPYTYGHTYPLQNYRYLQHSLAHPLGTNFKEGLWVTRYAKNKWFVHAMFTYVKYGTEPGGKTLGADIYRSSQNFAKVYGNYTGQGVLNQYYKQELKFSRVLQTHWGLVGELGVRNYFERSPLKDQQLYITLGIKTLLYREEKLF